MFSLMESTSSIDNLEKCAQKCAQLTPYRRHLTTCKAKRKGPRWQHCTCPIWVYAGRENGKPVRYSLETGDWATALAMIAEHVVSPARQGVHLVDAVHLYMDDCESRNLENATLVDYRAVLNGFTTLNPEALLHDILPSNVVRWRKSREVSSSTDRKELTALRAFFHFCRRQRWIADNPACDVRMPADTTAPTLPFTPVEIHALLNVCSTFGNQECHRTRARALILLLLYSGLRIGDAVRLRRDRIDWKARRLTLRAEKTGALVTVRLPPECIAALDALPKGEYLFWRGGKGASPESAARQTLKRLAKLAGVANVHPHRFRDTFSCRLLEQGVDIRVVQHLLGHSSLRTTERHYAPWVASHQRLLDAATDLLDFSADSTMAVMPLAKH